MQAYLLNLAKRSLRVSIDTLTSTLKPYQMQAAANTPSQIKPGKLYSTSKVEGRTSPWASKYSFQL